MKIYIISELQLCPALHLHPLHLAVRHIIEQQVLVAQCDEIGLFFLCLLQRGDAGDRGVELCYLDDLRVGVEGEVEHPDLRLCQPAEVVHVVGGQPEGLPHRLPRQIENEQGLRGLEGMDLNEDKITCTKLSSWQVRA